jgi:hypothetical protein
VKTNKYTNYSFSLLIMYGAILSVYKTKWVGCEVTCGVNQVSEEERINVTAVQHVKKVHSVSAFIPHDGA